MSACRMARRFGTAIAAARDCDANQVDLCGANLTAGGTIVGCPSETGKYDLTLKAGSTTTQYVLDATPVDPAMVDPACGVLSVRSTGEKCILDSVTCSNTNAAAAADVDACWGR